MIPCALRGETIFPIHFSSAELRMQSVILVVHQDIGPASKSRRVNVDVCLWSPVKERWALAGVSPGDAKRAACKSGRRPSVGPLNLAAGLREQ